MLRSSSILYVFHNVDVKDYLPLELNKALSTIHTPSFRRMPESSDNDRGDTVRQLCVVESNLLVEGAVVAWIPVYTGMTILVGTQHQAPGFFMPWPVSE